MNRTHYSYQALEDFKTLHATLGEMFKEDGITEEDRLNLAAQLTIAAQIRAVESRLNPLLKTQYKGEYPVTYEQQIREDREKAEFIATLREDWIGTEGKYHE